MTCITACTTKFYVHTADGALIQKKGVFRHHGGYLIQYYQSPSGRPMARRTEPVRSNHFFAWLACCLRTWFRKEGGRHWPLGREDVEQLDRLEQARTKHLSAAHSVEHEGGAVRDTGIDPEHDVDWPDPSVQQLVTALQARVEAGGIDYARELGRYVEQSETLASDAPRACAHRIAALIDSGHRAHPDWSEATQQDVDAAWLRAFQLASRLPTEDRFTIGLALLKADANSEDWPSPCREHAVALMLDPKCYEAVHCADDHAHWSRVLQVLPYQPVSRRLSIWESLWRVAQSGRCPEGPERAAGALTHTMLREHRKMVHPLLGRLAADCADPLSPVPADARARALIAAAPLLEPGDGDDKRMVTSKQALREDFGKAALSLLNQNEPAAVLYLTPLLSDTQLRAALDWFQSAPDRQYGALLDDWLRCGLLRLPDDEALQQRKRMLKEWVIQCDDAWQASVVGLRRAMGLSNGTEDGAPTLGSPSGLGLSALWQRRRCARPGAGSPYSLFLQPRH